MRYTNVCIESLGCVLPDQVVTSEEIERRLRPFYERLNLPEGRLELMSGVRERRFWAPNTRSSAVAALAGRQALDLARLPLEQIGCLVHASVCRDFLEPATANLVHQQLDLPPQTMLFDLSNACLGVLNGMTMVANMIELGQIRAGIVVSGECAEQLVENTIRLLLTDERITRSSSKQSFASLTIGSAAAAVVLTHADISRTGHRLLGGAVRSATQFHDLCQGSADDVLMQTQSEMLMQHGCKLAAATWRDLHETLDWSPDAVDQTFCHQVGSAHSKLMEQTLKLDPAQDFTTYEWLGNTGSAALPSTMALGVEQNVISKGNRVALLGIGSGINCMMLGVEW